MCLSIAEIYRTVTYCRDIALSKCEANNSGTLNISLVELRRYYSRGVGTIQNSDHPQTRSFRLLTDRVLCYKMLLFTCPSTSLNEPNIKGVNWRLPDEQPNRTSRNKEARRTIGLFLHFRLVGIVLNSTPFAFSRRWDEKGQRDLHLSDLSIRHVGYDSYVMWIIAYGYSSNSAVH